MQFRSPTDLALPSLADGRSSSTTMRVIWWAWLALAEPTHAWIVGGLSPSPELRGGHAPDARHEPRCVPSSEPFGEVALALNRGMISGVKGVIDAAYAGRDFQRFYVLETIARVPYFAYLSCLHLYESLGMRSKARHMRERHAPRRKLAPLRPRAQG